MGGKESTTGPLAAFPLGVSLQIVSYLNYDSLRVLLSISPELKKRAILLTDSPNGPCFFQVYGVALKRIFYRACGINQTTGWRDDLHGDLYPIRFIEITKLEDCTNCLQNKNQCPTSGFNSLSFTSTSIVFVQMEAEGRRSDALTQLLDEQTDSQWIVASPVQFPGPGSKAFSFALCDRILSPDAITDTLISIQLTECADIYGLSIPNCSNLSVSFPSDSETRQLISRIHAPLLRNFVVHYHTFVPIFMDLQSVATSSLISSGVRVFELVDIRSIGINKFSPYTYIPPFVEMPRYLDDLEPEGLDMSFVKRFNCLNLIGTPRRLLQRCHKTSLNHLRMQASLSYSNIDSWTVEGLTIPNLQNISITVASSGLTLPAFLIKDENLVGVTVNVLDPRLQTKSGVEGILESLMGVPKPNFPSNWLTIYKPQGVPSYGPSTTTIDAQSELWRSILGGTSECNRIEVTGFTLSNSNRSLLSDTVIFGPA